MHRTEGGDGAPVPDSPSHRSRPRLLRILRSREGTAISLGVAIGAGIFRTPGEVAAHLPRPGLILLAWVAGGLLVLLDATVLAELAAARPGAGGHYVYLRDAYGRRMAFLYGWTAVFLTWPASVAALGAASRDFALRLGLPPGPTSVAVVLFPAVVHTLGLRTGSLAQDLLSYGKALALGAVVVGALVVAAAHPAAPAAAPPLVAPLALAGIGLALQQILWTYDGYADAIFVAEETSNPGRAVPRALHTSVLVLVVLYVGINAAFLTCLTPAEMAGSKLVAADALGKLGGPMASHAIECIALLAVLGAASATLLSGPRIAFAMARDGLLFDVFARVTPAGTPLAGLLTMTVMALVYLTLDTFEGILMMTIFVIWVFVTLTTVALFVFRVREPRAPRPYRVPLYPVLPALLLVLAAALLGDMLVNATRSVAQGSAIMLAGVLVFEVWRRLAPLPSA